MLFAFYFSFSNASAVRVRVYCGRKIQNANGRVQNSFLVVTLSSGIIAALPGLVNNPASIPTLLAQNLPKASTFFLTYIVLQGLTGTASGFLQAVPLVLYYVKLFLLGSTPRSIYAIKYTMRSVSWGTLFPSLTLLVVISESNIH